MSSDQRASSPSPVRRSASQEKDPKIAKGQQNALKGMQKRKKKSIWDKYSYHFVIGGFLVLCAAAVFSILFSKSKKPHLTPIIDAEDIDIHNAEGYDFKIGHNDFFADKKISDARPLFNNQFSTKSSMRSCGSSDTSTILESDYDFRTAFPECVNPVVNQGNCSSSFAIAPASALSNRICSQTKQKINLSAQTYIGCANSSKNCDGGVVTTFVDFATKEGLVEESCLPYTVSKNKTCPPEVNQCKRYNSLEYCAVSTAEPIKREILKNGPVVAVIPVYRDFLVYKDGIYHVIEGTARFQGGHAIKIIGWGKDSSSSREYWIVENSWGESWGVNGYGHIAINEQNLYIDHPQSSVLGVTPRVDKVSNTTTPTATETSQDADNSKTETQNLD